MKLKHPVGSIDLYRKKPGWIPILHRMPPSIKVLLVVGYIEKNAL
jgi:hypothetical protein